MSWQAQNLKGSIISLLGQKAARDATGLKRSNRAVVRTVMKPFAVHVEWMSTFWNRCINYKAALSSLIFHLVRRFLPRGGVFRIVSANEIIVCLSKPRGKKIKRRSEDLEQSDEPPAKLAGAALAPPHDNEEEAIDAGMRETEAQAAHPVRKIGAGYEVTSELCPSLSPDPSIPENLPSPSQSIQNDAFEEEVELEQGPSSPTPKAQAQNIRLTEDESTSDDDDDDDDEETYPAPPPLHIHISCPTTITGSHNRLILPSPTHLSSLVSLAVKRALQSEDGEVKEGEQQMAITVDAGTKIQGNGNVVGYYPLGKGSGGGNGGIGSRNAGSVSRTGIEGEGKRRANSEPIDELRVTKRVKN
ncbi:MAG: hypothetical protein Q9200_003991 [Gallowayella weberi]